MKYETRIQRLEQTVRSIEPTRIIYHLVKPQRGVVEVRLTSPRLTSRRV